MTNSEMVETFLMHAGIDCRTGCLDAGEVYPIVPFVVQDISFSELRDAFKGVPLKGRTLKYFNRIKDANHDFMAFFFDAFKRHQDKADLAIDKMDELAEKLRHDIFIQKIQASNCFNAAKYDDQMMLAAISAAAELAYDAEMYWVSLWPKFRVKDPHAKAGIANAYRALRAYRYSLREFGTDYLKGIGMSHEEGVSEKNFNLLKDSCEIIAKHICEWVTTEFREGKRISEEQRAPSDSELEGLKRHFEQP